MLSPELIEILPAAWCDGSAVGSSVMEAVSFVTPLLESLVAGAVAGARRVSEATPDVRAFLREEASHSRRHLAFNAMLARGLGATPPMLRLVRRAVRLSRRLLSPRHLLLVGAALEHFAAVISRTYLEHEARWRFASAEARALFATHAREELAHRAVVFDLCAKAGRTGRVGRSLAILGVLVGALLYVGVAVPWIVYRKSGRRPLRALATLAGFVALRGLRAVRLVRWRELFSFARADFHPGRCPGASA